MRTTMAIALLALVSAPVLAFEGQPPAKPKKERKVCKDVVRTGSNLPLRKCLTRKEWTEYDATEGEGGMARMKSGDRTLGTKGTMPGAVTR